MNFIGFCALISPPTVSPETGAGYAFFLIFLLYYYRKNITLFLIRYYHGQPLYDSIPRPNPSSQQSTNKGTKPREWIMSFRKKKKRVWQKHVYNMCSGIAVKKCIVLIYGTDQVTDHTGPTGKGKGDTVVIPGPTTLYLSHLSDSLSSSSARARDDARTISP